MAKKSGLSNRISGVFSNYDIRIIIVFLVLLFLAIGYWLIQRKDYVDCEEAEFYVIAENFSVGEVITFNDQTHNAKKWEWDFGDGSPKGHRQQIMHKFLKEGTYVVKLRINGFCLVEKKVEIKNLGSLINQSKVPAILAPKVVEVGAPVRFYYEYGGDPYSWEWSFGESGQMDNTEPEPVYIYQTPGAKNVTLIINGDVKHMTTRTVYVKPREKISRMFEDPLPKAYVYEKDPDAFQLEPGDPQRDPMEEFVDGVPLKPKPREAKKDSIKPLSIAPDISNDQFELMLMQVANQSKTKEDFAKYICDDYEIPVVKNGKVLLTFSELCKNIKGKEIKVESIRLTKDNLNCVDGVTLNYKVKKFFYWVSESE